MTQEDSWYDVVGASEKLEQGDLIDNCEVVSPIYVPIRSDTEELLSTQEYEANGVIAVYDVIIISQSCDLEQGKIEHVLLCPRKSYSEYIADHKNDGLNKIQSNLEAIRQGKNHRFFMLNTCDHPDFSQELQIIDVGTVFSIPYDIMKIMAKSHQKRLRLRSPYKEKVAQAFAYYYMRIALPVDIPQIGKSALLVPAAAKRSDAI